MNISALIVTMSRPDCMQRCIDCLRAQSPAVHQIIVVDASPDDRTRKVCEAHPGVVYLRNELGYGHMTHSRNIGLRVATGDIVAFIDDDAFAHPGWTAKLLEPYADPGVGGVGGRARNLQPGEETAGLDRIGKLLPNGLLTGNFAADPGKILEVDHIIGCNMSYRREILLRLGGLREEYPGTEVREETDIALRVKRLGYRILFTPFAVVDHIGAPQMKGRRFDARYFYYDARNHTVLLLRNFGLFSRFLWRYLLLSAVENFKDAVRRFVGIIVRSSAVGAGTCVGAVAGLWILLTRGHNPVCKSNDLPAAPPKDAPSAQFPPQEVPAGERAA